MKSTILKSLSLFLLLATALAGCSDPEGAIYNSDSPEYAFAGALQKTEMVAADGNKITVPVYRGNKQGSSTLELTLTLGQNVEEGLFKLSTPTVTFEDGQAVADAVITYDDINSLGAADMYELTLSFDEKSASPANLSSITINAQRKLTFKSIGTGTFTSNLFGESWPQEIEKAEEAAVYRLPDCYTEGYPILFSVDEKDNITNIAIQQTGYKYGSYGMTYLYATGAEKVGKSYNISACLLVVINGEYKQLTNEDVETLDFPE